MARKFPLPHGRGSASFLSRAREQAVSATALFVLLACLLAAQQGEVIRQLEAELPGAIDPGAIMMVLAVQHSAAGNSAAALGWLAKAADLRQGFDPSGSPGFESLRKDPAYVRLLQRIHSDQPPVKRSRLAFTSPRRDLVTEGIAADPATGALYVGSLSRHAILRITREGRWETFTAEGVDRPLGMAVDLKTRSLWVCNNSDKSHAVLRFHLDSARLLERWTLPEDSTRHTLNDLAVTPGGEAWVTDSAAGKLYHAVKGAAQLQEADFGRPFLGANGITLAPDKRRFYLACFPEGIVLVDPEKKQVTGLRRPPGVTLAAIDGLYWHKGKLFGIQNTWVVYRVAAWTLNAAGDGIESQTILERAGPYLKDPTTGAFLGDRFYFIANSELEHWKDGKVTGVESMRPLRILAIDKSEG